MFSGIRTKMAGIFRNKKFIICAVIVVIISAGIFAAVKIKAGESSAQIAFQTAVARRGDISVTVTGSGSLVSANRMELAAKVPGTVNKVLFKEGDPVKAGDLIYEIDDSEAKLTVERTRNSLEQARFNQRETAKSVNKLNLTAEFNGYIDKLSVKKGDVLQKNSEILVLTDKSKLKVTLPFNAANKNEVYVGQKATVYVPSFMADVPGTVASVVPNVYTTASGGQVFDVEITVDNPGSLGAGIKVNADIISSVGNLSSVSTGALEFVGSKVIRADSGGTVKDVHIRANQYVTAGQLLVSIENEELILSKETQDLKVQDLEITYASQQEKLNDYRVFAPFDGILVKQKMKVGDEVKQGDVMAVLADPNSMEFDITVDELDIAKIQIGQKAVITIDALPETESKPLAGSVANVALEGSSSNGVTTYPVTVRIDNPENLKGGMNANAEILVATKTNVVYIPIEAVQTRGNRNFVMVKSAGAPEKSAAGTENSQRPGRTGVEGRSRQASGDNIESKDAQNDGISEEEKTTQATPDNSGAERRWDIPSNTAGRTQDFSGAKSTAPVSASDFKLVEVTVGINNNDYIEIISGINENDIVQLPSTAARGNNTRMAPAGGMMMRMGPGGGGGQVVTRRSGG